jgi:shikimate 5-dehydrogenase
MLASLTSAPPPMRPKVFAQGSLTYNLVYGDVAFAREHGVAQFADGLGMLVKVAAQSCYVWHETRSSIQLCESCSERAEGAHTDV